MRITDLDLANEVIKNQGLQIEKLHEENLGLKKELNKKEIGISVNCDGEYLGKITANAVIEALDCRKDVTSGSRVFY